MPKYIDADELPKVKFHALPYTHIVPSDLKGLQTEAYERGWNDAIDAIVENAEIADVVERKHGEWIFDTEPYPLGNPYGHYECDQCGEYVPHKTNFCPFCGAKMDGKETENATD